MKTEITNTQEKSISAIFKETNESDGTNNISCDIVESFRTNGSVDYTVAKRFWNEAKKYTEFFKNPTLSKKEIEEAAAKTIANCLTQNSKIIVRNDRWYWFHNGKHFERCNDAELGCKIRELSENLSHVWKSFTCTSTTVRKVLRHVQEVAVKVKHPDDIRKYIIVENGILNLDTLELEEFTTDKFITNMVNVKWDKNDTKCPAFDKIIKKYTGNDAVLAERLIEALAVCLTNDYVKRLFCLTGVTNSGKSFLLNFLLKLINIDSTVTMQPNDFKRQFAPSMVYGKSLCCCMDMDAAPLGSKATAFIKGVSGFDILSAEFKGENGCVSFQSRAHIINASNFDIVTKTPDMAFDMRKLVIPFRYKLTDDAEPFEELMSKLMGEKSAIFTKLILAYRRLKDNNYVFSGTGDWYDTYVPPTKTSTSVDNSLQAFLDNCCIITENKEDFEFTEDLFDAYKNFAYSKKDEIYWFQSLDAFSKAAKNYFSLTPARKRNDRDSNPKRCYLGIKLKTKTAAESPTDFVDEDEIKSETDKD